MSSVLTSRKKERGKQRSVCLCKTRAGRTLDLGLLIGACGEGGGFFAAIIFRVGRRLMATEWWWWWWAPHHVTRRGHKRIWSTVDLDELSRSLARLPVIDGAWGAGGEAPSSVCSDVRRIVRACITFLLLLSFLFSIERVGARPLLLLFSLPAQVGLGHLTPMGPRPGSAWELPG